MAFSLFEAFAWTRSYLPLFYQEVPDEPHILHHVAPGERERESTHKVSQLPDPQILRPSQRAVYYVNRYTLSNEPTTGRGGDKGKATSKGSMRKVNLNKKIHSCPVWWTDTSVLKKALKFGEALEAGIIFSPKELSRASF